MPSLNTTTVSINKENTKILREAVAQSKGKLTVGAMVNAFVAEKLKELTEKGYIQENKDAEQKTVKNTLPINYKELPLCYIIISINAEVALRKMGIATIGKLLNTNSATIASTHSCQKDIKEIIRNIEERLAVYGLKLAD